MFSGQEGWVVVHFNFTNLAELVSALGQLIKRSPHNTVQSNDEHTHQSDSQNDPGPVTLGCCLGDVCTESVRLQGGVSPGYEFGNNAGIPGSTRSRDGAGDPRPENARSDESFPLAAPPKTNARCHFPKVIRDGLGSANYVEQNVPLGAQRHQQHAAPVKGQPQLDEP